MRKATMALLGCAYVTAALAAATLFWMRGAGWGAGAAVLVGVLALLFGLHNLIARGSDIAGVRRELGALRDAHRILADHLEETEGALEELAIRLQSEAVGRAETLTGEVRMLEELAIRLQSEALGRAETLTGEVRMLEDLVARMGEDLEARLHAAPSPAAGAVDRQGALLLETVRDALTHNRVDLYLQPVVALPQRRVVYYESFTRLRDATGRIMMPAEYLTVAEPEGLVSAIDNLLLFRCVQIVRRLSKNDRRIGIFCNISPASLGDESFFPQFLDFLGQNRDLSGALIFELGHAAFKARGAVQARSMAKLADLGFRFSLDKVGDLNLDFADLQRADVKFVKVAAPVLLEQLVEDGGQFVVQGRRDLHAADFAGLVRRHGVELVAEKVEAERQVIDILELDIAFAQGNLFGEPRAIKDEILAETAPPVEMMAGALRRAAR